MIVKIKPWETLVSEMGLTPHYHINDYLLWTKEDDLKLPPDRIIEVEKNGSFYIYNNISFTINLIEGVL